MMDRDRDRPDERKSPGSGGDARQGRYVPIGPDEGSTRPAERGAGDATPNQTHAPGEEVSGKHWAEQGPPDRDEIGA